MALLKTLEQDWNTSATAAWAVDGVQDTTRIGRNTVADLHQPHLPVMQKTRLQHNWQRTLSLIAGGLFIVAGVAALPFTAGRRPARSSRAPVRSRACSR